MSNDYKFDKVHLDGRQDYEIVKAFASLSPEQLEELKKKEGKGPLTSEDIQRVVDMKVAKSVEETITEDLRDLELMTSNWNLNHSTEPLVVRKISFKPNLFGEVNEDKHKYVSISGKGSGNIFNRQVEQTVQDITESTTFEDVSMTRVVQYKDEMVSRVMAVTTVDDYLQFSQWYTWYLEEDKENFEFTQKMSSFILVVLVEVKVFGNYNMDISELQTQISLDNYPINSDEEYFDSAIDIVERMNKKINEEVTNFEGNGITWNEFARKRAESFKTMFAAVR